MILSIVTFIVKIINLLFILFVLFFERKESSRRLMWVFILFLFPGFGIILYILFSGHFFTGSRRMKEANIITNGFFKPLLVEQSAYLIANKNNFQNHVMKDFLPLIEMNINKGDSLLVSADSAKILTSGKDFFDSLKTDIKNAKKSIYMEYFIFKSDKIGHEIMELLCKKAREGVDVKLLYDDLGSIFTSALFFRQLNIAGGKARPFFLIRIGFPFTLNYRNHRKVTIIDSTISYTGGVNIGDEYANQSKRIKLNWRDTVVRVTGAISINMQTNFLIDWFSMDAWTDKAKTSQEITEYYPHEIVDVFTSAIHTNTTEQLFKFLLLDSVIPTQIVLAGPDDAHKAEIEDSLIRMIMSAKKNVFIQTPYFTPDEEFYNALKLAAFSGVDVRVMIPRDWDKIYMKAASSDFAKQIIGEGVKIYLYPGFIHSKTITIDGNICSIGTTNIDSRSFFLHFEQNIIFYDSAFTKKCEKVFIEDQKISTPAHINYYNKRPLIIRALWSFCRLFTPLM